MSFLYLLSIDAGAEEVMIKSDSNFITTQVRGEYRANDTIMKHYLAIVRTAMTLFGNAEIYYIPRDRGRAIGKFCKP